MKLNFTSGLVLVLISIFVAPVAVLSYRALNSPTEPSTAPTTQMRMLDSPLARIPYLPLTSNSISGKPNKPTPEPATVDWGDVTNKPVGFADDLDNDALEELACDTSQLAIWNGSAWECFSLATLEEQIAALVALHPTPTPTPIPIPPRDLNFDQPIAISGSAGITGWRSSAVVDGQGAVHVVWLSTPTPSSIMYTSKPAGGVWSQPFNVSGATLGVLRQDLAVSLDGTVHVVWRQFEEVDGRGFNSVLYSSKSPSGGWTPPQDIDQSDLDVDNPPLITVDGSGKVHVVWQDNYTTSSGAGWSTPVKIGGNFNDTRDLIAKTNGILHLLSKKSEVLYHTIRDGAGTWGDPEIIASDASQGLNPNLPSLHVDNAGTLHAGWIARPPGSDTTDKLFHSTKGPSSAWSLPVVVNPVGNAGAADMMVFSGGEAIGVWANAGDIEISALHPDGTWLPAVAVAQGSWPVVAPEEPDTIHLFFNSGAQLFYTNSQ